MKKFIALCILSTYLLASSALGEVIKLPILFQHYFEHKSLTAQLSFDQFLIDHYNSIPHTDNDEERDNQLPFKTLDQNGTSLLNMMVPISSNHQLKSVINLISIDHFSLYKENFNHSSFSDKVWQPPKYLINS